MTDLTEREATILDFAIKHYALKMNVSAGSIKKTMEWTYFIARDTLESLRKKGYLRREKYRGQGCRNGWSYIPLKDAAGVEVCAPGVETFIENGVRIKRYPARYAAGYGMNTRGFGI